MNRTLSEFTNIYQLSETLTFELRPTGKTAENLKKSGLLEQDFQRAEDYPKVKEFLDEQHKQLLQRVLSQITDINWLPLANAIAEFQKNKDLKEDLEKKQADYREKIVKKLKEDSLFLTLVKEPTPSKLFKQLLATPEAASEIETFARFACYFKGFQENRKNIYSEEAQQTAAAFRAVNENFPKFLNIVNIYASFQDKHPELVKEIESRTQTILDGRTISDMFKVDSYNLFLPQSGIDFINAVIGEINYAVNQYRQQHPEIKAAELPFMPLLFKQILSDREQAFTIKKFENDTDLYLALREFAQSFKEVEINGCKVDFFPALQKELAKLNEDSNLFVDAKSFEKISTKTTGNWYTIQEAMLRFAEQNHTSKTAREKYCNRAAFNLQEIKNWDISVPQEETSRHVDITTYWTGEFAAQLFEKEKNLFPQFEQLISEEHKNLRNDEDKVQLLKEYLDSVQEILHLLKPFNVSPEYEGDQYLSTTLMTYCTKLESIIPLYNQTRNYILKKPTDEAKVKLMFNKPTLADGWDNNKEKANSTVVFRKNDCFFLGIIAPGLSLDFEKYIDNDSKDCYQKMVYKLLPGPNKMLPKVFFSQKNIDFFSPSAELLRKYKLGAHLKGEEFDLAFCHELIDFFKKSIFKHEDWSKFGFSFSPTCSYTGIDEFYREVAEQGYILNFVNIPDSTMTQLVGEGKLYLFQIWNKDFSPNAAGTPNKFTLYWKEIFSAENLADIVFKLNGEAELFLRPQAIEKKIAHRKDEKIVNRTIVTAVDQYDKAIRQSLPESVHHEIFLWVNGLKAEKDLSSATRTYLAQYEILHWQKGDPISAALNKIIVKNSPCDIIKDKRFTEDKYALHVPITINFKSPAKPSKFNEKVLRYLENNPDVKIIGLDRGERNLIYLTLIDQQGRILEQKSLNVINGVDYHGKLDLREKERQAARKSWKEIGQIKELKSGYLSGVVYEIARMMVENNAIVVMEELNFGFKRGRMKIEKQVYQNFERALIEKLNYLVFKDQTDRKAPGGTLAGYQLTDKFESFKKLTQQCGFLFYVPAAYTSKIDPATGFINIFDTKECTSAEAIKSFFDKFDSIRYSAAHDSFAFGFDYNNFKTFKKDFQNKWTVYSLDEAWSQEKDKTSGKFTAVRRSPTSEIKKALIEAGVKLTDGYDLLALLQSLQATHATAAFFRTIFYAFKLSTALRHSSKEEDKIISPVLNSAGTFFVSGTEPKATMPQDADANGAFHIALKGLYLLRHGIKNGKLGKITNEDWLKFVQTRNK